MKLVVNCIAIGFIVVMLEVLLRLFINPNQQQLVSEPSRWISGIEILMGLVAIRYLIKEVLHETS